jgi:hypothetical protein
MLDSSCHLAAKIQKVSPIEQEKEEKRFHAGE